MNICHVTSVHTTFDTRIFHKECKTLLEAGHDVTLVAQADWRERTVDGVRVVGLPRVSRRYQRLGLWRLIVREVERLRPDVVHFHDPELLLIASRFRPARVVYDCHEPYAETMLSRWWIPHALRYPLKKVVGLVEPLLARGTDAIVVTADEHAHRFRSTGRPIVLLRNFPMLAGFDPPRSNNGKVAVHLGQQTRVRGCSVMVEAMRSVAQRVPEARLHLVGPFDDPAYEAEVERQIQGYGLQQAVIRTGLVPYADVPGWLAKATVGLIGLQETEKFRTCIPTKLFEYMIAGLPVVSSDLPPARKFMDGVECGFLVRPADPHEYAAAVESLFRDPLEARRMGENGRRAVEHRYNWTSEAQELLKLYQKLG
jgi:glycosyltransferase involved in cell wall biosynthesis